MHEISAKDGDRQIDWGRTSQDYALHRPGYPESFFDRLTALGVGTKGQRVLDLGTGTGVVARRLAQKGCLVTGVDIAAEQIRVARELANRDGLNATFEVAPAEETGQPSGVFDVVVASQCWLYFERDAAVAEVRRLLGPGGRLVTCHLCWLPRLDPIASRSEALVLEHNPGWTAADWPGLIPAAPSWIGNDFKVAAMFYYDEGLPFTRESGRGRIRACRGVGASMSEKEVASFDAEHSKLLNEVAPDSFEVLHRIDAHILAPTT